LSTTILAAVKVCGAEPLVPVLVIALDSGYAPPMKRSTGCASLQVPFGAPLVHLSVGGGEGGNGGEGGGGGEGSGGGKGEGGGEGEGGGGGEGTKQLSPVSTADGLVIVWLYTWTSPTTMKGESEYANTQRDPGEVQEESYGTAGHVPPVGGTYVPLM
jgi:hypothetical protein